MRSPRSKNPMFRTRSSVSYRAFPPLTGIGPPRHPRERGCNPIPSGESSMAKWPRPVDSVDTRIANSTTGLEKQPPSPPDFGSIGAKAPSWNWITASFAGMTGRRQGHRKISNATHQYIDSVQPSRSARFRPGASGSRGRNRNSGTASRWPRACLATRRAWFGAPQQCGWPGASGIIK
jgi:hypothetical protein